MSKLITSKPEVSLPDIQTENRGEFPYKKLLSTPTDIILQMTKLRRYKYSDRLFNPSIAYSIQDVDESRLPLPCTSDGCSKITFFDRPTILLNRESDYNDFNTLSDYFQEHVRLQGVVKNCYKIGAKKNSVTGEINKEDMSPVDYYYKNHDHVKAKCIKEYGDDEPHNMRETLYHLVSECTSFRPCNLVAIVNMFKSKYVLDFSSGWGDRLIGAIACYPSLQFYCGVDPNEKLIDGYKEIIKFFKPLNITLSDYESSFKMIYGCFEDESTIIPDKPYDLVFTSPPYFDFESYASEGYNSKQSIKRWSKEKSWYENFLVKSVDKSWNLLIKGGYYVLILNQRRENNYLYDIINHITNKSDAVYLGVICYSDKNLRKPQPMWIWYKK